MLVANISEFGDVLVTALAGTGELSAEQNPGTESSTTAHERSRITMTLCQVRNIHTDDTALSRWELSRIVTLRRPILSTH